MIKTRFVNFFEPSFWSVQTLSQFGRSVSCDSMFTTLVQAFAVFGGVYAFAQCVIQRLRQKEDIYTSGLAGCATGLVMGIGNGFQGALASAAMMGGFSVVIDLMGKPEAQAASLLPRQEGQKVWPIF